MTLFFDLDGTLTDSAPGILDSVRYALEKMGASVPDPETLNRFIGPPLVESFARFCGFDRSTARKAVERYRERFAAGGLFMNSVYGGVPTLLERLNAAGAKCVVTTAKPECFARRILARFDLAKHFSAVHGATMDETRNTKAAVIAWALAHSGARDGEVVVVGDRADDVEGAKANGLPAIGVLWGYGDAKELSGAMRLAETPEELADLLLKESLQTIRKD